MKEVSAPISVGDLLDRLSILEIKSERLDGQSAAAAGRDRDRWQELVDDTIEDQGLVTTYLLRFRETNRALWDAENDIRSAIFADDNVRVAEVARRIVELNDQRSLIKADVNSRTNSSMRDPKSYG